jgi:hypothetical protein
MKIENTLNQTFLGALLIVTAIVLSAISFKYSGRIQLGIGSEGIQMMIDGSDFAPPSELAPVELPPAKAPAHKQ